MLYRYVSITMILFLLFCLVTPNIILSSTGGNCENVCNYQIDNYLESREKLFEWTVIIHNEVNKLLGKEIWSVDKALKHYKNFNIKS